MPVRLPLFPLDVVLFPGVPLPLHIFEPRYRRMLADVLEGDRRFGLTPVGGDGGPEVGAVGCAAEVRGVDALADGRSNIVVVGAERFTVTAVLDDPAPYAVGLVAAFDDDPASVPAGDAVARLAALHARHLDALRRLDDPLDDPAAAITPTAIAPATGAGPAEPAPADDEGVRALSFEASAVLRADEPTKRRLLGTRDTAERVSILLRFLPALVEAAESAAQVRERASGNGRGG
jgi:Lon protease-like protein